MSISLSFSAAGLSAASRHWTRR